MNRTQTVFIAAFEALVVLAIGLAIPLVPLTVLWGAQYGFAPDWAIFWRASADIWLLGHGTDLTLTLDAATAKSSGFTGAAAPFAVSIAALGFALLTLLLARRAGRRIAETGHGMLGAVIATLAFAAASLAISLSAVHTLARPSVAQGTVLPALVFCVGVLLGTLGSRRDTMDASPFSAWTRDWRAETRATVATALRGGVAAAAAIVAVAAVLVAGLVAANYAEIITLYEGLHSGALGGAAITIAEIAFLPNLVIWGVSWLVGPGFAIGTGSAVSPLATSLGPIPAIPVFGALPHGDASFAFVGLLVPVLAGFLAGALLARGFVSRLGNASPLAWMLATGLGIGVVGGALVGILAWCSAGSIGPGRLQTAGPDPWAVGLWAALEIGLAALAGLAAASRRASAD